MMKVTCDVCLFICVRTWTFVSYRAFRVLFEFVIVVVYVFWSYYVLGSIGADACWVPVVG